MSEIVDLDAARRVRAERSPGRPAFEGSEYAMEAIRAALDALADACEDAGRFWPTSAQEWGSIVGAGVRSRLKRRARQ